MALQVVATFAASPETLARIRGLLVGLVGTIRKDPGCTACQLTFTDADDAAPAIDWREAAGPEQVRPMPLHPLRRHARGAFRRVSVKEVT